MGAISDVLVRIQVRF